MTVEGVDYAFPPRPRPSALAAAGKRFAVRYGGPGSSDKQLDAAEANALKAAGLWIVANAEGSAGGMAGGFAVGASWARTADAHFRACGMPADRPIYLSVDFDVTLVGWPAVRDALSGAASEIGFSRVGIYGGRRAIAWARRDEVAAWFWQTYAWSGGVWEPGNHMEQYRNGVPIDGADCDLDRALQADFGQWQPGYDGEYGPIGANVPLDTVYTNKDGNKRTVEQMIVDLFDGVFTDAYAEAFPTSVAGRLAALEDKLAAGGLTAAEVAAELAKLIPAPPTAEQVADMLAARLRD